MVMPKRSLGGEATKIKVGEIGYGLMGFTIMGREVPDEEAFKAMKAAIDSGATFWNAGVFYGRGPNGELTNITLISRFFAKYPQLADKVFLSVKGGVQPDWTPNASEEFLRKDVESVLKALDGKKKLDMFECARVDSKVPVEKSTETLAKLIKEGKFDHIGLSEVSASTIRRAHKIHPIATVEIEYSFMSTEAQKNGVLDTCKELGIAIIAYSPLGRGILSGKWKTKEDVPDFLRQRFPRYSDENFETNMKFVHFLDEMAKRKGVTAAQIAIKWVTMVDEHIIPIPGAVSVNRVEENMGAADVKLSKEELDEINKFVAETEAKGGRYAPEQEKHLWG